MPNGIRALPDSLFIMAAIMTKNNAIRSKIKQASNPRNDSIMYPKAITSSNISYLGTGETSSIK